MDDQSKQLQLIGQATELTQRLKNLDGSFMNVFSKESNIPQDLSYDIEGFYRKTLQSYTNKQEFPNLSIEIIKNRYIQEQTKYLITNADLSKGKIKFGTSELTIDPADNIETITEKIQSIVTKEADDNLFAFPPPSLKEAETPILNASPNLEVESPSLEVSSTLEDVENPPKKLKPSFPSNMSYVNNGNSDNSVKNKSNNQLLTFNNNEPTLKLNTLLKYGDATNPNTILAYYYLKMRDYIRVWRRLMSFARFYQGNEKEHLIVKLVNENIEVNHLYSTQHNKLEDEYERLKRYMGVNKIKSLALKN